MDESSDILPFEERVKDLAIRKANCLTNENQLVIGSDTIVAINGEALGKPRDAEEARDMLTKLSGRSHLVITGVAFTWPCGVHAFCEEATVSLRELTDLEINGYIATGEPMDKAGAYAIQGGAAAFAEIVRGDINTVIGLPITALAEALDQHGVAR